MRAFESRRQISLWISLLTGLCLLGRAPFPTGDPLYEVLREQKPEVLYSLVGLYNLFLFTTPFWVVSVALSALGRCTPRDK